MNDSPSRKIIIYPKQKKLLDQLGENLKLARKRRRLTQKLVCERADINPATLRKIEQGNPTVALGHYLHVLSALGLGNDIIKLAQDDVLGRLLQDAALLGHDPKRGA